MWLFEIDRKASWLLRCEDFEWKWDLPCIRLIVAQLLTRKQQNSLFRSFFRQAELPKAEAL